MKLINKIILPFTGFAVFLLVFIVIFARQSLQNALFQNEFFAIEEAVASEASTHLAPADFVDPRSADAQKHFLDFTEGISDSTTARVTIWSKDSVVLYSDLSSIVGVRSPGRPGLVDVIRNGQGTYHSQPKDDEYPTQTSVGEFLDIYVPVSFAGNLAAVVEVHSVIGAVLLPIQRQIADISLALALGTLVMIILFFLLAHRFVGAPLKKIDVFLTRIEQGDFDERLDIRSRDEVGQLGKELNKMAAGLKRLRELKDEFVFIASHELRAPVAIIKGYLSMIGERKDVVLPEDIKSYMGNIGLASDRLAQLVNDILDIARSEAGRLNLTLAPCDLPANIDAIMREQKIAADAKRIVMTYDRLPEGPVVLADAGRLKEVIANLITNAVKYSPEGTAVKIYHEVGSGLVVTHVRDAGYGIPKKEQAKVFEKFFRSDSVKTHAAGGTGLGLFIAKQLVEKMNGKIWFRSREGGGSTFSFSLKAVKPGAAAQGGRGGA